MFAMYSFLFLDNLHPFYLVHVRELGVISRLVLYCVSLVLVGPLSRSVASGFLMFQVGHMVGELRPFHVFYLGRLVCGRSFSFRALSIVSFSHGAHEAVVGVWGAVYDYYSFLCFVFHYACEFSSGHAYYS